MRLLVSGGGTGGHVYPILHVLAALPAAPPTPAAAAAEPGPLVRIRYAGTPDGVEAELARRAGLDFTPIRAGQLRIRHPLKLLRNSLWLLQGGWQARRLMVAWPPDVLFVTGGYACAPVVWAAHRQGVPILIYLPDITPGVAVQRLARYATQVAVSFPEAAASFAGKAIVSGYPVRPELRQRPLSKEAARLTFGLDPHLPTVLVFGGSRGARSINVAIAGFLPQLLQEAQVIHITGAVDWSQAQARASNLRPEQAARYRSFAYLHDDMVAALCAADLVVARAGASTLGEFPALGLPAILIPLPISGLHQLPNARYLAQRGAAVIVADEDMQAQLFPVIQQLLDAPERLAAMSQASAALARPDAAACIAAALVALGTGETATQQGGCHPPLP